MTALLRAQALALASLPCVTPARLRRLLDAFGGVADAVEAVAEGRSGVAFPRPRDRARLVKAWRDVIDVEQAHAVVTRRSTHAWVAGDTGDPFRDDLPDRPPILLGEGRRPAAFDAPRVAIVGTRAASPHGLRDAHELGASLATAGVTVVSGLAIGIDAAAHEGALAAGGNVVGVVATGLDIVYPRRHRALYERVRANGVVVGEHGYGVGPDPARFPVRNRIIAGLADAVVVVEATATGGAAITARCACDFGRSVFAVPGSRRNPAAAGCNRLIADGALPLLEPGDVLLALGAGDPGARWAPPSVPQDPEAGTVLGALAGEAATLDELLVKTGMDDSRLAAALRRLEREGRVQRNRGRWWPM